MGRTKDHGDALKAKEAFDKAVKRKVGEGFWERDGAWPPVIEVDEADVERDDILWVVQLPKKYNTIPSLYYVCPPHLKKHFSSHGYYFVPGPGGTNLWPQGVLEVGRGHEITEVKPKLEGAWLQPARYPADALRPDGAAMLLGIDSALYEIDMRRAEARLLHDFGSAEVLRAASPFVYTGDSEAVLWRAGEDVCAYRLEGGALTTFSRDVEPVLDLARLASGAITVLRESSLVILEGLEAPAKTHEVILRRGFRVSTMLDGRVFVLMTRDYGPRQTIFYGVHGEALHELQASTRALRDCFDSRGQQFMIECAPGGELDWEAYRVFNVERMWRRER